jgi:aminocarboxymuconate-semialdehyde decarboxylase
VIVDVHAHCFLKEYAEPLERLSGGARTGPRVDFNLAEMSDLAREARIDLQVLSVGPAQPYLERAADAAEIARLGNDIYADASRGHDGRFAAFGCVPLPHLDAAIEEAGRCLDQLGMRGITVGCSVNGRPLDDPAFHPFFAELDRRGTILFLHPVGAGAGPGTADFNLAWMVGAPFEDTIAAVRLIVSGFLDRYPRLRVVVPHLGGTLPMLVERLDYIADNTRRAKPDALGISGNPSDYVKRMWYDTVNLYPAALRCAVESFGADRLLLGTDFPFLLGPRLPRCVTYVEQAGLAAEHVSGILETNAVDLLGLS